jgi:hypothetical protein
LSSETLRRWRTAPNRGSPPPRRRGATAPRSRVRRCGRRAPRRNRVERVRVFVELIRTG